MRLRVLLMPENIALHFIRIQISDRAGRVPRALPEVSSVGIKGRTIVTGIANTCWTASAAIICIEEQR